ncbi:MAG: triose-phosphate isomerase [Chloroflexi bacterium]|nr:triose-phosphate isomerase [Chloroflexota bacterium]
MRRVPIVAGNWKMNKNAAEAVELTRALLPGLSALAGVARVLCPPFTSLAAVAVSPTMLAGLCGYVILGHSERRQYFGESDENVKRKAKVALAHGLTPIICVGENLAQNETGQTHAVVSAQVRAAFAGLSAGQAVRAVIAYEPIWAIGTGKAATAAGANAVIGLSVRGALSDLFDGQTADAVRVQYGGSVTPANAAEFFAQPDIDGALVGGASLKPDFVELVRAAAGGAAAA